MGNLFRNFCLHLVNLFEFGVIGPGHVFTAISRLQVCPCEKSRPAARHLLGKSPALLDSVSRRHKLSHQQEVSKDEEELFWNFLQIYLILAETRHSSVSF